MGIIINPIQYGIPLNTIKIDNAKLDAILQID